MSDTKSIRLHLVLTHDWFDEIASGRKRVEYRMPSERWMRLIWARRERIKAVRFARGYTDTMITRNVEHIDIGPCPYDGWDGGRYIRVHFGPEGREK